MRRIDTTIANRKRTKTPNNCRQNNTQKHEHWNTAKKKKKKKDWGVELGCSES